MEMFDIRTPEGEPTGEVKERSAVHRDGDWHGTAHIWLVRRKNGKIEVLLQKRSRLKETFPGCYDASCAGHLSAGDSFIQGALRELQEELGAGSKGRRLVSWGEFIPVRWMTGLEGSIFWTGKSLRFIYMISLLRKRN